MFKALSLCLVGLLLLPALLSAESEDGEQTSPGLGHFDEQQFHLEDELRPDSVPSKTDDNVVERESLSISYTEEELARIESTKENFEYQAEVARVMSILVDSLYSNKDVALRELISNGSDALDKVRLQSLTDPSVLDSNGKLEISIWTDPDTQTLTIQDTGIGMTREELQKNLGTIARSGTDEFAKAVAGGESSLIGMFGVGFYSAFLIADRVTVTTKSNEDDDQWIWESEAAQNFSISKDPKGNTLGRGTRIDLHLKRGPKFLAQSKRFVDPLEIEKIIKDYSEFINFPIYLYKPHQEERQVPVEPDEEEEAQEEIDLDDDEDESKDAGEKEDQDAPKTKTVHVEVWDWELINDTKPIWLRDRKELTQEDYNSFYKAITKDYQDPLRHLHFKAEGDVTFKSILFIPQRPANRQFENPDSQRGIKLYVRRVFITDDFGTLFPRYLEFVKGVVDSDDLPLNVNRETLQQSNIMERIKKKVVRKAIAMIQQMANKDPELFAQFWKEFGTNIKLGVIEDQINRSRLSKLLRFYSSATDEDTSLDHYVDRMQEGQDKIYYLAGETIESLKTSPLAESLRRKGYEILYLTEPIDEYSLQNLRKYQAQYELVNIAKADIDVEEEDLSEDYEELTSFLKETLPDKVSQVKVTSRLYRSPCALVSSQWGYSANMERIMKAQPLAEQQQAMMYAGMGKILEINPTHPIIQELNQIVTTDPENPRATDIADVLYQTAVVSSGYSLDDPTSFAESIHRLLGVTLKVDIDSFQNEHVVQDKKWVAPEPKPQEEEEGEDVAEPESETTDEAHVHEEL